MRESRGGTGGPDPPPPLEKSQKLGVSFSNTGPDCLKNQTATKPEFNWRANVGTLLVVFGFLYQLKKRQEPMRTFLCCLYY